MQIYTKISQGTPKHDESSLCATCRNAHRISGESLDQETTFCTLPEPSRLISFKVHHCNKYSDERLPSLYSMKEIAWVVRTDVKTRQIGLVPLHSLNKEDREKLDTDDDVKLY